MQNVIDIQKFQKFIYKKINLFFVGNKGNSKEQNGIIRGNNNNFVKIEENHRCTYKALKLFLS